MEKISKKLGKLWGIEVRVLDNPLIAEIISMPKMEDLVKEYDSLSKRQWKRRRDVEHTIFWVAYKQFKYKCINEGKKHPLN